MTPAAAARKIATDTLRKLDATMGLGPVTVLTEDLYVMARYILSLSRPQAGTWEPIVTAPQAFRDEADVVGRKIKLGDFCKHMIWSGHFNGFVVIHFRNPSPSIPLMYFVLPEIPAAPSLTTPPATEEDA